MILSDAEIRAIQARHPTDNDPMDFARAIIAATLNKLAAGVSVEPDWQRLVYKATGGDRTPDPEDYRDYYTLETLTTAIAAARVAAINACADEADRLEWDVCAFALRALIGKEST